MDLLRALGAELATFQGASAALGQTLGSDNSFRTRYLLLGPAGHLARAGDATATGLLEQSLRADPSPYIRAEAARASAGVVSLAPALTRLLEHPAPRVREAALEALASGAAKLLPQAEALSVQLLGSDPWTFVRETAAEALGHGDSATAEEALLDALEDQSPLVRTQVVRALGKRKSDAARERLRKVAGGAKEAISVRAAAIVALGEMCDLDSVDLLTKLALRLAAPQLSYDRPLGLAALKTLGRIHPPDFAERIKLLVHPNVAAPVRKLAATAMREPGGCH